MPSSSLTFQEFSPLISYSPDWDAIYDHTDPFKGSYTGNWRSTSRPNATATFSFYGTGVSIFGSKRDNHGNYTVALDDGPPVMGDAFAIPFIFNTSLWSADGLPLSQHTVTLTNMPINSSRNLVDIDFITIQRSIGGPDDTIHRLTLDNTAKFPSVNYTGSWQEIPQGSAYNNSHHRTADAGAEVILQFRGCCIEVYGQYANANLTAVVDDQKPVTLRGFDFDLSDADQPPQTLLYLVDNLDEEKVHKVTLVNVNQDESRPLYFDYAVASSTQSISPLSDPVGTSPVGPSPGPGTPILKSTDSEGHHVPVVAIVVPLILGAVAISLLSYYLIKRRKKSAVANTRAENSNLQREAQPYMLPPPVKPQQSSTLASSSPINESSTSTVTPEVRTEEGMSQSPLMERGSNHEQDAGRIIVRDVWPASMPPVYDSTWAQNG